MLQRDELFAHAIFATDWGWAGAITSKSGLQHLIMPQNSRKTVLHIIQNHQKQTESDIASIGDLPRRINNYLRGQLVFFDDKLDLSNSTPFQQKVWETTRSVPYGETRSYAWVAHKMGMPKATRAIGQALAHNRLPIIIPCHRIINSNGSMGGFSAGLDMKARLLHLEHKNYSKRDTL